MKSAHREAAQSRLPAPLAWLAAAAALILLNASLTFANVWPTPYVRWSWALSAELALVVLAIVAAPHRAARLARTALPTLWVLLVLGRYLAVTGPGLYGREFNLYWDAPHLGNVAAMLARAAPPWLIAAVVVASAAAVGVVYLAARAAFAVLAALAANRAPRVVLATVTALVLAGHAAGALPSGLRIADPVMPAYARQVRHLATLAGSGPGLPPGPDLDADLCALGAADVIVIFVESYGAVTYDEAALAAELAAARADLDAAIRETGRRVVSAYVDPPTFGASSWLSHLSFMTGVEVRDQYAYTAVMASDRDTLARAFRRQGYRSVALMPGLRQPWPEGVFYGFAAIYGRTALAYRGPQFGWWGIPDQYTLAWLDMLERERADRAPLFAVVPTSNTHAPFGPVPPYQPDWARLLGPEPFDPDEAARALAARPDLTDLRPSYARATAYELTTFAGYLRRHASDPLVLILLGDHQPPAAVSGPGAPWEVPIHVIARHEHIVDALLARGFREGLVPRRPAASPMHGLARLLLDALGGTAQAAP